MSKSKPLLFLIVVVAIVAFFAATEVKADPQYPALTAPRTCTLEFAEGGSLEIEAGPSQSQFPRIVPCPDDIMQQCSAWDYRWTYTGADPLYAYVSVSSDVAIFSINPSAHVEDPPDHGDPKLAMGRYLWEQRTVGFINRTSTFEATIITEQSSPRVTTAGGLAVRGEKAFCLIQGPGAKVEAPISTTFEYEDMLTLCVKKKLNRQMAIVNLWYGCFDPDADEECPGDVDQFYAVPGEPWDWYYYGGENKNVLSPGTTEVQFREDVYKICPTGDTVSFMDFLEPSVAHAQSCTCPPGIRFTSGRKSYCICLP